MSKEITTGSRWIHKNLRMSYTVLFITNLDGNIVSHPPDVVYLGDNGNIWSRPLSSWHRSMIRLAQPEKTINGTPVGSAKERYKGPINIPCSACSAGDSKMEYHDHDYVDIKDRRIAKEGK